MGIERPKVDMRKTIQVRLKAAGIHLLASLVMAGITAAWVYGVWYPGPLAAAAGVSGVFVLLLFVDVSLGPLLTGLVYDKRKPELRRDLIVIVFLQLAALGYGVFSVAEGRPAWLAYNVDRFDMVRVVEIDRRQAGRVPDAYQEPPWFGPQWVSARMPDQIKERNDILLESAGGGFDVPHRPYLYRPVDRAWPEIEKRIRPLEALSEHNSSTLVDDVLAKYPEVDGWVPLKARDRSMVVLLDLDARRIADIVDLRPWN